jgi:hypothetical protein
MTPDQQQRAIEKVCGWIIANPENDRADYRHWTPPNCVAKPNHMYGDRPPNYIGDLNACHEMEKVLSGEQKEQFIFWLNHLHPSADIHYSEKKRELRLDVFDLVHTTAPQRAEAFLRTLGLWQPTPTQPQ